MLGDRRSATTVRLARKPPMVSPVDAVGSGSGTMAPARGMGT